jgi:dipeptidyl-peptidase-4
MGGPGSARQHDVPGRRPRAAARALAARLAGVLGLLVPLGGPAAADPAPPRLSLERVVADGYLAPLLSSLAWRPGRLELAHVGKDDRIVLQDALTGTERTVVAPSRLDAGGAVADRKGLVRGIGRAGPPAYLWSDAGDALFVPRRGALLRVDAETGSVERVVEAGSPISDLRVAPDGRAVAFARDFDLWVATRGEDRTWEAARRTTGGSDDLRNAGLDWLYPEELGCETGIWWSPDSARVAFLRLDETGVRRHPIPDFLDRPRAPERQPYPLPGGKNPAPSVGVVGARGDGLVRLDLGPDAEYVPWAAWVDEQHLVVATVDRAQRRLTLRLCSADDGSSLVLARESEPDAWIDPPEPPLVLRERRALVWRRPRAGWWTAVLVPLDGAKPAEGRALTKPGVDVERLVSVDEAKGVLWYAAAGDAPGSRALHRVGLDGGGAARVGPASGWHRADFDSSHALYVDAHSSLSRAPRQTLRSADGAEVRTLADAKTDALRALSLPPASIGEILRPDGVVLRTLLRRPAHASEAAPVPAVVFVYGGPGARSVRDAWEGLFHSVLVEDGFAVLTVDNRGSSGCGRAFETQVCRRLGRLELEDQVLGAEHLRSLPWVDATRLGIWGWSYGGTMACLALTRAPGVFRAGVAVAPVTDWRLYDSIYTERYLGTPDENEEGYREGSPLPHAARLEGALLLCHGLSDDNVHFDHSARFAEALLQAKKPFDWMPYPGRGHGIEGDAARLDLYRRVREHFRRHLRPESGR